MTPPIDLYARPEYAFLRAEPDLQRSIYLVLSGSYGYGTNVPGSDIDLRGTLAEPPRCLYGLSAFEQYEDRATDTVIYGLKKYVSLCVNANPNALELLGVDKDCIVYQNEAGKLLRGSAHLFLTKRVIRSFGNYATAQLRRLTSALWHDYSSPKEQEQYLADSLNNQMSHFNSTYSSLEEGGMRMYLDEEDRLVFDVQLQRYPLRDFIGIYSEMNSTVKTHGKLNHRGRKKDEAHLYKHAMHLIRLLLTGTDILRGKGIVTKRTAEHDFLMDIRHGRYSFAQITRFSEEQQALFKEAAENTRLPDEPDIAAIEDMMRRIYAMMGEEA